MTRKGGFKNIKLGKNVYRQIKRRGQPDHLPAQRKNVKPAKPTR